MTIYIYICKQALQFTYDRNKIYQKNAINQNKNKVSGEIN